MFTKEQASQIRQEFWTALGKYLSPVPSASGEKVNWINYKTGVKGIRFRMDAENKYAFVAIEIRVEAEKRKLFYDTFESMRNQLPENYEWIEDCEDEHGKPLSRIYCDKENVTIFNKDHWPELISFFKENIIILDAFWTENKDIFEMIS